MKTNKRKKAGPERKEDDTLVFKTEEDYFAYLQTAPMEVIDEAIADINERLQARNAFYVKRRSFVEIYKQALMAPLVSSERNYDSMIDRITQDSWADTGDQLRLSILRNIKRERMAQEES